MPVTCPYCCQTFEGEKLNARHLSKCNPELKVPVPPCLCGHVSTSLTQMKRHRQTCDQWKTRDKKATFTARSKQTFQEKYGVDHARHIKGVNEKIKKTCLERYGAENQFARESSIYDVVQKAQEGNRFAFSPGDPRNPFSQPEVQQAIRELLIEKYGEDNPQKVPEIRQKTRETNLERYGYAEPLASPEIRAKIRSTCETRYGGPAPSNSPEVVEKARQTNLERWGVEWTCQHEEVRRKQRETMREHYGSHFFASEEGKEAVKDGMTDKYGAYHPSLVPVFRQKQIDTFREHYPDLQWPCLQAWRNVGPNGFEMRLAALFPEDGPDIEFTGNRTFWVDLPRLGKKKNPDFVVRPHRQHRKVIEAFGDYFHSEEFTGKCPREHEEDTVAAYADKGIACLVVWESELGADPESVAERLREFLAS